MPMLFQPGGTSNAGNTTTDGFSQCRDESDEPTRCSSAAASLPQVVEDISCELHGLKLRNLSVGGVAGELGEVHQGFRGCMQVLEDGLWRVMSGFKAWSGSQRDTMS